LREDLGYFTDAVGDWSEHPQETLLDMNGKHHPILTDLKSPFWGRVRRNFIANAYRGLIVWDLFHQQIIELEALKMKYSNVISLQKSATAGAYEDTP
jgi:hypothetical protein